MKSLLFVCVLVSKWSVSENQFSYFTKEEDGTIAGDVQNWAVLMQNYILQLASDGIRRDFTQQLFDQAEYTLEIKNGTKVVVEVKKSLDRYFSNKKAAAQKIAKRAQELYDSLAAQGQVVNVKSLKELPEAIYKDSDIPSKLHNMEMSPYFKQEVSFNYSTVKISDEVPRDHNDTITAVNFTFGLEDVFRDNYLKDKYLRWQYFGSMAGVTRLFPGREWSTNFAGFYNDYDPRVRPWYIAATSGPKDVIVVLDCSLSMKHNGKFSIVQAVAKNVINTLTKQDYVNVICARASHWDQVGKWHFYSTEVLSCQQDHMVQATNAHRKDLIEKVYRLEPGGTSELEKGFEVALDLFKSKPHTGCQSILVFVTDGKDTDGEEVRCGPGYYTRSGYVPGPVCRYNWTKVWDTVRAKNMYSKARIFSYLTKDEGESLPGKLACDHRGSMTKLTSGENLISEMSDYFGFLSTNSMNTVGLWTSPYLDSWGLGLMVTHAVPVVSNVTGKTIGVAAVDATLDEIENLLTRHQWGSVYSFLINKQGETIYHPSLKPSANLLEDPIFIPINQLEQNSKGEPPEFTEVREAMMRGEMGSKYIPKARKGISLGERRSGVQYELIPATYYYSALNDSEYAFAFSLTQTDKEFRRSQEPSAEKRMDIGTSYFNLVIEYNATKARKALPGVFEEQGVDENNEKYPCLRVTDYSSIFFAPKCHCDPNAYFYDEDLAQKTIDAHLWMNGNETDVGCDKGGHYEKGIRADVLITQKIEKIWQERSFDSIDQVKWTYVGIRSGVFRTYPGHRSKRQYDPSKRPWFNRAKSTPDKTSISTPYMDAAGVGKIVTISQAVLEGMTSRTREQCLEISTTGPWPGGCVCETNADCVIGVCYRSDAKGPNSKEYRCGTERVEAVTSLDILYNDFHTKLMDTMLSSDKNGTWSCGRKYLCPDKEPGCQTSCYVFDNTAKLIIAPDFLLADNLDTSKYAGVTLGVKEAEVMKDLIFKHKFFKRQENIDFQGQCSISPNAPRVTLQGIPSNPEELDNYYKNRGPIPKFSNNFGCIQDVVGFKSDVSALGPSGMLTGNVSGPCMSGFYYVTALPKTNLFLLVIENKRTFEGTMFFEFNCRVMKSIAKSGAYRIINGTCAHQDNSESTLAEQNKCPRLRDIKPNCTYTAATSHGISLSLLVISISWCLLRLRPSS